MADLNLMERCRYRWYRSRSHFVLSGMWRHVRMVLALAGVR